MWSFLSFEVNVVVRERLAEAVGYPSNSSIWSISSVSSISSISSVWSVSFSVSFTKARELCIWFWRHLRHVIALRIQRLFGRMLSEDELLIIIKSGERSP